MNIAKFLRTTILKNIREPLLGISVRLKRENLMKEIKFRSLL